MTDPNVDILWPDNATANLVARRSIKSGRNHLKVLFPFSINFVGFFRFASWVHTSQSVMPSFGYFVGEELHITYIDASMAADERRSFLEQHYGFTCKCARCREGD